MFAINQWRWISILLLSVTALLGACSGDDDDSDTSDSNDNGAAVIPDMPAYRTCQEAAGAEACQDEDTSTAFYVWGHKLPAEGDEPSYLDFTENTAKANEAIMLACAAAAGGWDSEGLSGAGVWQDVIAMEYGEDIDVADVYDSIVQDFCPNAEQDVLDIAAQQGAL